ncbi:putative myo-inositol 1-phosphate synthase [Microstroma glucosiphilum]|uniref:Inositol-3-phosphate synthase n=1 Tax=Pseudomicrostroma glucosiphilum TaxID=1684307 RepID=A0A316U7M8_9BASI|nr:putative myo-inositol 1-phosphate synthase [Pseudomicrostroma glucosiphilum]PWN18955.1 putative myo-inositol 1-phosphate synthase [Pseudomicrostroma glucosiphilum]
MAPIATGNGHSNGHTAHANGAEQRVAAPVNPTAARHEDLISIKVDSPHVKYEDDAIISQYSYRDTHVNVVNKADGTTEYQAKPVTSQYQFKTGRKVPKTGLMMVGWGGNNGTTLTASVLSNRENLTWNNKEGLQKPNFYGSLVRASTIRLGSDPVTGKDIYVPFGSVLPMVHPNDLVLGGWDISGMTIDAATTRAKVLDYDLQRQLVPLTKNMKPLRSIYYPDFIAANQEDRVDNILPGSDKQAHLDQLRTDIREFKQNNGVEQVIVVWTANTERYSEIIPGVNDTADNLLNAIKTSHSEVSPSTLFAVACILERVPYINGAPQNTFVPGAIELAERHKAFIGGDDLKTGQTRFKTALAEMLVNAGIKPLSIASYNHLGNNDGHNLSVPSTFQSKEISKRGVVDDLVESNALLYPRASKNSLPSKEIDHCIVIKYLPAVGDGKVAMDDYYSELTLGGRNRIMVSNICEDSLLATPILMDLVLLAELMTRITYTDGDSANAEESYKTMYTIMSLLSFSLKAPLAKKGREAVNAISRQRNGLANFMKGLIGLPPNDDVLLESRLW